MYVQDGFQINLFARARSTQSATIVAGPRSCRAVLASMMQI